MKRFSVACAVAPLWMLPPCIVVAVLMRNGLVPLALGNAIAIGAGLGVVAGYALLLCIGLPAHLLLRGIGLRSIWAYQSVWFALAIAVWTIGFIITYMASTPEVLLRLILQEWRERAGVPLGYGGAWAAAASTFWLILRPDRSGRDVAGTF